MNVIEYEGGVIGLTENLKCYVEHLIDACIEQNNYEIAHKLIDVLSILDMHKEDTLLEMNKAYFIRVIEENL